MDAWEQIIHNELLDGHTMNDQDAEEVLPPRPGKNRRHGNVVGADWGDPMGEIYLSDG